jgi:SMI1-KNR4 cell-wall
MTLLPGAWRMTKQEIRALLSTILPVESRNVVPPTVEEWQALERRFGTRFPPEFVAFIELMSEFSFPGDIYNVSQAGATNGNDTIELVYENERKYSIWPDELIPFYGGGNGDYFALSKKEGESSAVYYRYHENGRIEKHSDSFDSWLAQLPEFLR